MTIKRLHLITALVLSHLLLLTSCASDRSSVSMDDAAIFMDRPKIVETGGGWFLSYRYAKHAFLMSVDSGIENGRLVFYVSGLTSTGSPGGRTVRKRIQDTDKIALIKGNRAFWKEPDGSLVRMNIVKTEERR